MAKQISNIQKDTPILNAALRQIENAQRAIKHIQAQIVTQVNLPIFTGKGSPNGSVTASIGALYLRLDGGANTTLYVKESGTNTNSGWTAK